jgi:hypothetical protein
LGSSVNHLDLFRMLLCKTRKCVLTFCSVCSIFWLSYPVNSPHPSPSALVPLC